MAKRASGATRANRAKRRSGGSRQSAGPRPAPQSFRLSAGWLAFLTVAGPTMFAGLIIEVLARTEGIGESTIWALWAALGAVIAVRLPLLVYTVLFDRNLVLGEDSVHVPIAGLFQVRPWNLAYRDIESVTRTRMPGWSPMIVFTLQDSSRRRISTTYFVDEVGLLKALHDRVPASA